MTRHVGQPDLFGYPARPGWKARQTAQDAAASVAGRAPRLRQLCLEALHERGPMTADECADRLQVDKLSIRPRFSELAALGRIRDSGERHLNASHKRAIVWTVTREETP
jgi:predicted HTH transcriptional regulator